MNPTTSQDALTQLQSIQAQSQDPNTILANQRQQLGVDAAQNTVTGLRGAINNTTQLLKQVAPSVMGRTGSSLVTNAQAGKQISNEQAPINQTLTDQGTQLGQDQSDLSDLDSKAQEAATGIYQGQQDKLSYAQNLYNALYQKEKDAQAESDAQAAQQEQIREYNASLAQKNSEDAASASSGNFNLGGSPTPSSSPQSGADPNAKTLTGGKSLSDASTALKQLLATNNGTTIRNTLSAIEKSAQYGNTYDQAKLQLINSQPEFKQILANFNNATF